jgi:phage tail sheath protein FI
MRPPLSPGVFVEEVPSAIKPIAGVSTTTAGFIGIIANSIIQPLALDGRPGAFLGTGDNTKMAFELPVYPIDKTKTMVTVKVDGEAVPDTDVTVADDPMTKVSTARFTKEAPKERQKITADIGPKFSPVAAGTPKLCTSFSDFKKFFGDFSGTTPHDYLVHAVYGFFNNGGSRCYVMRVTEEKHIKDSLVNFEAVPEIAMVAAPGLAQTATSGDGRKPRDQVDALTAHCKRQNRFAIFDCPETPETTTGTESALDLDLFGDDANKSVLPPFTDSAAFYFPWLQVLDPVNVDPETKKNKTIYIPPSGHIAGIYARVDNDRGVHKAPANEPVIGTLDLKYTITKAQQDGLNPQGVNCIRNLNGNLLIWGARTLGGDKNADLKYVHVRRTLLFLRRSIEEGTQWVVFEPNEPGLWQKITRNITAFLTNVWRSGALFGTTVQEAFYVKCDAATNPLESRDLGQVVTEIGVAIVRPAEFVIFRISQYTAPSK